jgi:hypothetical protein
VEVVVAERLVLSPEHEEAEVEQRAQRQQEQLLPYISGARSAGV